MKLILDTDSNTLTEQTEDSSRTLPLYSKQSFEIISQYWLKVAWDQKHMYGFTWMGRPIIQLPEDMVRMQEVIYRVAPDVIIETGVAHGGSLIYYASLCKAMEHGRVIGIDIEIRSHNRAAIEAHPLSDLITLIEGSSIDPAVVEQTRALVGPGETVLVILDSCHTKAHVMGEIETYHGLVTLGSYIVATDGFMQYLNDLERGKPDWSWNNPANAAQEFVSRHPEFELAQPPWPFRETNLDLNVTHWPDAWMRRR